jgi:hypothetical protein
MENKINDLKTVFIKVIDLHKEDISIFDTLESRILKLKGIYSDYSKYNKDSLFTFGLDSFHFQSKLIDIEYDDMKRIYLAVTNRIYCEYFKLYKLIIEYVTESIHDKKITEYVKDNHMYPIYKDLEPYKKYDFELIVDIHDVIIGFLLLIDGYILSKEDELRHHQQKNDIGLNLDNFVNTCQFNNTVVKEKLKLFISYIDFFHKLHVRYFKRFTTKMQLFISQINHDIKFDDSIPFNDTKKQSLIDELEDESIKSTILNDLKNDTIDDSSVTDDGVNLVINEISNIKVETRDETDNVSCLTETASVVKKKRGRKPK